VPYHSVSVIESGEIAHDMAVYIDQSLQIKNAINIGLEISPDSSIVVCGGILLMAMPGATEDEINTVFDKFNGIKSFTRLLKEAITDEDKFCRELLDTFGLKEMSSKPIQFSCHCDSASIEKMLHGLSPEMLDEYKDDDGHITAVCQYCGKEYKF
jgi:molecular chaperone Hsp33